jgi:hypothetical protein
MLNLESKPSRSDLRTDLLWLSLKLHYQVLDVSKYLVFGAVPIHNFHHGLVNVKHGLHVGSMCPQPKFRLLFRIIISLCETCGNLVFLEENT